MTCMETVLTTWRTNKICNIILSTNPRSQHENFGGAKPSEARRWFIGLGAPKAHKRQGRSPGKFWQINVSETQFPSIWEAFLSTLWAIFVSVISFCACTWNCSIFLHLGLIFVHLHLAFSNLAPQNLVNIGRTFQTLAGGAAKILHFRTSRLPKISHFQAYYYHQNWRLKVNQSTHNFKYIFVWNNWLYTKIV